MREKASAGLILVAGLMLIVAGVTGRLGDLLGAVFAPDQMQLVGADQQQIQSGGIGQWFGVTGGGTSGGGTSGATSGGPIVQPGGGNRY